MYAIAQIGLDPKAMMYSMLLGDLLLMLWMSLLLASLVTLGWGLHTRRTSRGKMFAWLGASAAVGLVSFAFWLIVLPQHTVDLDLRNAKFRPAGNWIGVPHNQDLIYSGRVDLHLLLPDGKHFEGGVNSILVTSEGQRVSCANIYGANLSRDDAFALASLYIDEWGCERNKFDQWCAGDAGRLSEFFTMNKTGDPKYEIRVQSGINDAWSVNMVVFWPREEGP